MEGYNRGVYKALCGRFSPRPIVEIDTNRDSAVIERLEGRGYICLACLEALRRA